MKPLLALATLAAFTAVAALATPALAAGNGDSFLLAQAPNPAQKQPAKKIVPPLPTPNGPSCVMDGRYVEDKTTWCVTNQLQLCNAATGQWINMGKRCGN